jgi:hypothetical protein
MELNNGTRKQIIKQNNLIYLLIGFILPMFLIIYVSAEQQTIQSIAEQELNNTTTLTES